MSDWGFSAAVIQKAHEYLDERRVYADPRGGIFWVQGSAKGRRYRVQTDADPLRQKASWITCTCPHGAHIGAGSARCSHAVAVLLAVRDRRPLPVGVPSEDSTTAEEQA